MRISDWSADWCSSDLTIMADYGLPPSVFTYVGDNPAQDFTAPSAMGWRTVQITRPGGVHNAVGPAVPDIVISSLADRMSVVSGHSVSVSVDLGGRRIINKNTPQLKSYYNMLQF